MHGKNITNMARLDALLNALIGDLETAEQVRFSYVKLDFKRGLDHVDDERAEQLAGLLLRALEAEAA
jgi:hypothetical protein